MSDAATPFGDGYAEAYDTIYATKDYAAEAGHVLALCSRFGEGGPTRSLLDVGCGSGRHSLEFARRGLRVTGVDRSAAMVARARARQAEAGVPESQLRFHIQDATRCAEPLDGRVDAAVMMFAVMGYLTTNAELRAALQGIRKALRPGGVFVFDVWHAPAVLSVGPSERVARWELPGGGTLLRAASSQLNVRKQTCQVDYELHRIADGVHRSWKESHTMRYFSEQELAWMLDDAGMTLAHLGAFPNVDVEPDVNTWNVCGVAVAR